MFEQAYAVLMANVASESASGSSTVGVALVDPRAPRFGQAITTMGLVLGIALQEPLFVLAIAVVLNVSLLSGWRLDLYGFLWRNVMLPLVGRPEEREPAAPHRFAKLMGAAFTGIASVLLFAAPALSMPVLSLVGYAVAGMVAVLAGIAAVADICVGCRMYRQVSFFRRLGVV